MCRASHIPGFFCGPTAEGSSPGFIFKTSVFATISVCEESATVASEPPPLCTPVSCGRDHIRGQSAMSEACHPFYTSAAIFHRK
ncbi:hypothetical protein NDU88_000758 [Pleurodeles waltl]|uniref:Uncharacterized protein n=1 Tax=Pleurodeles waltl TaxID=8319 RepID=A0AAV7LZ15_PLEWA|nr:hypothetical protein NDU88_000758 [Pleurodeles waltl]